MPSGTIARLLIDKGFGFIRDEGGVEHFFHRSSVRGAVFELLREGQRVDFTVEESPKGPRAGEVRLIEGSLIHIGPGQPTGSYRSQHTVRSERVSSALGVFASSGIIVDLEANGARWPSRSSKPVAPRQRGEAGFDSQALPPLTVLSIELSAQSFAVSTMSPRPRPGVG